MRRKMKYGHNLPFCSLVMALSNGQKRTLAEHKDVAMKLTFELLHIKLLQLFFVLSHICMQLYSQRHHIRCEIWSQNELFYNLGDYMFCWNKAISALLQNKIRLFVHIYHRSSNIQDHNQCNISHSNKNQKLKCLHYCKTQYPDFLTRVLLQTKRKYSSVSLLTLLIVYGPFHSSLRTIFQFYVFGTEQWSGRNVFVLRSK